MTSDMRVALVSPYSWTYPGGVTRHIEALATELRSAGHDVRVLAPFDPDVRRTALLHRGARPQERPIARVAGAARADDRLAVQRRGVQPRAHAVRRLDAAAGAARGRLRRRAPARAGRARRRLGRPDLHRRAAGRHVPLLLREPPAARGRRAAGRAPQAQPPVGADRGLRGGGLDRPALLRRPLPRDPQRRRPARPAGCRPRALRAPGEPLRIVFVGQAVERKGLPVLLRAFEALRRQVPAELSVVGVEPQELAPMLLDPEGVTALGRIGDAEKRATLEAADVLCAPSLGGESFGMVLTEAFAAGTPVVASDIAGYRDVVTAPRRRAARPARRRHAPGGDAARPRARPRPHAPPRLGRRPQRRALRVAAGRHRGRRHLRGRARRRAARGHARARRRPGRHAHGRRHRARAPGGCRRWSRRSRARRGPPSSCSAAGCWPARRSRPPAARCWRSSGSACARSARRCWPPARPGCSSRSG